MYGIKHHVTYFESNKCVLHLDMPTKAHEISVSDDILLAGLQTDSGGNLILPKGKYEVVNDEITFTPTISKAKVHCFYSNYHGTILGHEYSGSTGYCWTWIWEKRGTLAITLQLNEQEQKELLSNNLEVDFVKDFDVVDKDFIFTVKAGKYTINQDGVIYLQDVSIK